MSSGDQACHMLVLATMFLVPSLHIEYFVLHDSNENFSAKIALRRIWQTVKCCTLSNTNTTYANIIK